MKKLEEVGYPKRVVEASASLASPQPNKTQIWLF